MAEIFIYNGKIIEKMLTVNRDFIDWFMIGNDDCHFNDNCRINNIIPTLKMMLDEMKDSGRVYMDGTPVERTQKQIDYANKKIKILNTWNKDLPVEVFG